MALETEAALTLTTAEGIATICINRPDKRNAFDTAMWQRMTALCTELGEDPSVKIVVLRSASPAAFSAGADIAEFDELRKDPVRAAQNMADIEDAMAAMHAMPRPTIAVIDGHCFGGGLALALCCDFRIAGPTARFAITPARLGLSYSLINVNRLVSVAGHQMARRILMLSEVIKPGEALEKGLIDRLSSGNAEDALDEMVQSLLALSQYSVRSIKQTIRLSEEGGVGVDADDQARLIGAFAGPDLSEGMTAFLEKRKPRFPYT